MLTWLEKETQKEIGRCYRKCQKEENNVPSYGDSRRKYELTLKTLLIRE
jgi:hypothetical protein